ncbi:MAG TPA: hypothetical protein PLK63_03450 [Catalimonadaceae bacterium]|nr:hypothetical protein [Catalimonadaceae bacterium]
MKTGRRPDHLNALDSQKSLFRFFRRLNNRAISSARMLILLVVVFFSHSCSVEKKTWTSLAWHNTLAHYNGYFIAREKMKEFEDTQLSSYKDNYNRVLDVFPFPPLGSAASANASMEEIIKKASIPIQRHKNSKWVDDCYLLIGKARFYKEDWENAIQTFKFINTKFTDQDVKHNAVIWLLITYTRMGDISNAKSVIAYLKKETLSKENLRQGALAFAYYYHKKKDYQKMLDYMSMGVQLSSRSREKGRLSFVLGQLNQKFKHDDESYKSYKTVLRCWPSFELEFYTRLNMAQVVAVSDEKQLRKIRKNFKRMTTDLKFEDYLDRVYYEMGLFEIKQNNMPQGLAHLRTSLKKSKTPTGQKPYTYLKLAELHYNPLKSFDWAKKYYDSTMLGLDSADDNYKFVARRQKILTEFVTHYYTIQKEDSLQKLAKMDTVRLYSLIDKKIRDEKEKLEKADRLAKKQAADMANGNDPADNSAFDNLAGGKTGSSPGPVAGGEWYFSNLVAVANGRMDFKKKWGNRKLEDNWRRSNKQSEFDDSDPVASGDSAKKKDETAGSDPLKNAEKDGKGDKKEVKLTLAQERQPYLKDIPFSDDQLMASNAKLEVALFEIGRIYDQKLEEPGLAIASLERDVTDFPRYEKVPEALYNLCMLYKKSSRQADYDRCKDLLLKNHPESVFAKLILNPNYLIENKQRNEIISGLYKTVFDQYKSNMYIEASNGINNIRTRFPKSDFEDKLAILEALITAKTVDIPSYKVALNRFLVDFPKSDLVEFANLCLKNAEKGNAPAAPVDSNLTASASKPNKVPEFKEDVMKKQYFLALIPTMDIPEAQILAAFSDFNMKFYPGENLQVTSLPFGDNKHVMIKIQELPSKIQSMYYLKKVQEAGPFKKDFKQFKPTLLLVTQENLQLLYKSKAINEYAVFYAKHYDLKKELDDDVPSFGK